MFLHLVGLGSSNIFIAFFFYIQSFGQLTLCLRTLDFFKTMLYYIWDVFNYCFSCYTQSLISLQHSITLQDWYHRPYIWTVFSLLSNNLCPTHKKSNKIDIGGVFYIHFFNIQSFGQFTLCLLTLDFFKIMLYQIWDVFNYCFSCYTQSLISLQHSITIQE